MKEYSILPVLRPKCSGIEILTHKALLRKRIVIATIAMMLRQMRAFNVVAVYRNALL